MSIFFNSICFQKALFHRISSRLKSRGNGTPHPYKYENFNISKYIETAERLDIDVIPLGFRMFELRKGNITRRLMSDRTLDKENPVSCRLCCNKYLTYKVLEDKGIKHFPKHGLYSFKDIKNTYRDFQEWNCPVVIKPCTGTHGGTGVTVNIRTVKELKKAIAQSFVYNREYYLMEQYIEGFHFRVLTLKGDFIACSQRIPAKIIGNGKDSIKKLIQRENYKRSTVNSEEALYPIIIDNEVKRKLKSMSKTLGTVLDENEEIYVHDVLNLHVGSAAINVENVSDDIKAICEKVAKILNVYLVGFDIITSDICKPLYETNGVINEVNTCPGLEVIYKVTNPKTRIDVAEIILRDMFSL